MGTPTTIKTARLTLILGTVALARAEIEDRPAVAALLGAVVPEAWPPEMLEDALAFFLQQIEAASEQAAWITWYGVMDGQDGERPTLVASAGFFGPPQEGTVEIGYSIMPNFQRKGDGSEMVGALMEWAFAQEGVGRIVANVAVGNTPSVRLQSAFCTGWTSWKWVRPTNRDTSGLRGRRGLRSSGRRLQPMFGP